ncbi:phage tail sheath C-terminal domain-containing protein [Clostridium butyricum]
MGMPEINVSFKTLAKTADVRSERGIACIVIKDATIDGGKYVYTRAKQIKENFDEANLSLIKKAFNKYGDSKVVVYVIHQTVADDLGTVTDDETLTEALKKLNKVEISYLAFNFELKQEDINVIKTFVEERTANNMDLQVITNSAVDNEYFINFASTGVEIDGVAVEPYRMMCELAFVLSATPQTQSATYYVFDDVTAVNELDDEDKAVDEGKIFITFDGSKYKLSRAVNSKTTLRPDEKQDIKKIKIVEGRILVKSDIYKVFRDNYVGKCNNDYNDRLSFVADVNRYLVSLAYEGILNIDYTNRVELDVQAMRDYMEDECGIDTTDMKDIDVLKDAEGYCGSKIFIKGQVRFVDAMEDCDIVLYV